MINFRHLLPTAALLALLAAQNVQADIQLPDMGDSSETLLSAEEDRRLGEAFMRSVRQQSKVIEAPDINSYINGLGYKLLAHSDTGRHHYTFFVIDDKVINAFAGPGGYIGINSGLILNAQSEGELAAVIAHEIAHVRQRHLARAFEKAGTNNLETTALILAALLLGGQNPELAQAAITASVAGNMQRQLNFTRSNEQEADRVGIDILAKAGYDPHAMPAFFDRLQQAYRYMESDMPELLRTHPVTTNRIADSTARADQYPQVHIPPSTDFALIRTKLSVMTQPSSETLKERLQALKEKPEKKDVDLYEEGLILLQEGNYKQARAIAASLLKKAPDNIQFIALHAQTLLKAEQASRAESELADALKLYPGHPTLMVLYAQALTDNGAAPKAVLTMRDLIQHQKDFMVPSYYTFLAQAESDAGQKVASHEAMAEYYYMTGYTRSAISQLETALEMLDAKSGYQWERINARLREFKQEVLDSEQQDSQEGQSPR